MKLQLFIGRKFFIARARAYIVMPAAFLFASISFAANSSAAKSLQNLKSSDLKTKYAALQDLESSHNAETTNALAAAAVQEQDARFRLAVLDQLAAQGRPGVIPQISPLLKDKTVAVRQRTAQVIGILGGSQAEQSLANALAAEKNPEVTGALLQGLSLCGSVQSVAQIQALAGDAKPEIRANARHALERIQKSPQRKAKKDK